MAFLLGCVKWIVNSNIIYFLAFFNFLISYCITYTFALHLHYMFPLEDLIQNLCIHITNNEASLGYRLTEASVPQSLTVSLSIPSNMFLTNTKQWPLAPWLAKQSWHLFDLYLLLSYGTDLLKFNILTLPLLSFTFDILVNRVQSAECAWPTSKMMSWFWCCWIS